MSNPAIFISYRIADTQVEARLLFTDLANQFGESTVFLDKKRLKPGMDWPIELEDKVKNCKFLLVLIKEKGKWLGVDEEGIRRTDDPKDWVRLEIEHAVKYGKTIIPLLFNGTGFPTTTALPQSLRFLPDTVGRSIATEKWDSDIAALFADLGELPLRKKLGSDLLIDPLAEYPLPKDVPDPLDYHPAPFLGLQFFSYTSTQLFFGRTREILEFFSLVENPDVQIISLFGQSGVGKSSLLAAGVLPRLEIKWQPEYKRRQKAEGLGMQLAKLREKPKTIGKPPVYILDQVEEIFTDLLPGERENFLQNLRDVVSEEPLATVVLGFRSDFYTEVSDLTKRVDCIRGKLEINDLNESALIESIEGVWKDKKLKDRYEIEIEKGFANFVARDLMRNESGGASAILQNRLLKLYEIAKTHRNTATHLIQLRIADYEKLSSDTFAEEELLDFQIQRLRESVGQDPPDEKTIVGALHSFVLDKPTAGTVPKNNLPEDPKNLREALRKVSLLTELPDSQAIRLSHDLLAPIVRRRHSQFLMDETKRLEIENVKLRLRQVRTYLANLDFANALQEFKTSSLSHTLPEEVWPYAFELAFVFFQARKRTEGVYALSKCVTLMGFANILIPLFQDTTFEDKHEFPDLLDDLRQCDPALFIKMERRYFPTMIQIKGGKFEMGDVLGQKEEDETVHSVTISNYELAETPITWYQFGIYCLANEKEIPNDSDFGRGDRPLINVSWYDAIEYTNWLSKARGYQVAYTIDKNEKDPNNKSDIDNMKWSVATDYPTTSYRLPTEAEWEFAARERGSSVRFGNGKNIADPAEINFDSREPDKKGYSVVGQAKEKTTSVRQFSPNMLGLYDLSGNVEEWCYDWFGDYLSEQISNPTGFNKGSRRVLRGGSWVDGARYCRTSYRGSASPEYRWKGAGFRIARTL